MEIEKAIVLYYDKFEDENGDGFYIYPFMDDGLVEIIIAFARNLDGDWYQISKHSIMGFDGQGAGVLKKLDPGAKYGTKIFNDYGLLLYEKTV
jgi:hypothetical protein